MSARESSRRLWHDQTEQSRQSDEFVHEKEEQTAGDKRFLAPQTFAHLVLVLAEQMQLATH